MISSQMAKRSSNLIFLSTIIGLGVVAFIIVAAVLVSRQQVGTFVSSTPTTTPVATGPTDAPVTSAVSASDAESAYRDFFTPGSPIAAGSGGAQAAPTTRMQIRAFHDDNGDGQYGNASQPNAPSFEGAFFISADIDITDEATGKQIDLVPICRNNGHAGGVGREFCDLPDGTYTVKFNGVTAGLTLLKSRYNFLGVNPVTRIKVTAGQTAPIVEFGYSGVPSNSVLLIRTYVDLDGNKEYGATGAHSETSAEGTPFSGTTYKLYKVVSGTKTLVDPKSCFAGDFNVGGVGRDYCWVPPGTYEVDIDPNPDQKQYTGPFKEVHNANGTDPAQITFQAQPAGGNTPAIIDFGYTKRVTQVLQAAVPRCQGGTVVDQLVDCSEQLFKNPLDANGIFLCRDDLFFDCFTGIPVMQKRKLSFLATNTGSLSAATRAEITRLVAGRSPSSLTFIIGGQTDAVSSAVETEIKNMGFTTTRIGSQNRRGTARLLSEHMLSLSPSIDTVELSEDVVGMDAIAISPVAANAMKTTGGKERVILLTKRTLGDVITGATVAGTNILDPEVITFLNAHKNQIKKVEIIGGDAAVSFEVEAELKKKFPAITVARITGTDRFDTTGQIDATYFTAPTHAVLAFGRPVLPPSLKHGIGEYAALAGARIAAFKGAPLVLSDTSSIPTAIANYLKNNAATIVLGEIVGDLTLVPQTVHDEYLGLIK